MRSVIFDLDGTLADTSGDLIAAANSCFTGMGLGAPLDADADKAVAFQGGRAMLRLGFQRVNPAWAETDIDTQVPTFLAAYAAEIDLRTRLYPGATDAVAQLREAGFAVGICTNKPQGLAELLLSRLGVRDMFASLVGADTLAQRKPHPAPYVAAVERAGGVVARSILIGDTITDRDTARAAGVPCVLVTFGPEGDRIAALKPQALLHDYQALHDLAQQLLPPD